MNERFVLIVNLIQMCKLYSSKAIYGQDDFVAVFCARVTYFRDLLKHCECLSVNAHYLFYLKNMVSKKCLHVDCYDLVRHVHFLFTCIALSAYFSAL